MAPDFKPLSGHPQVLHPSLLLNVVPGLHLSSSSMGQNFLVQGASGLDPFLVQRHVLQPSSAAKVSPGIHDCFFGPPTSIGGEKHAIKVHAAESLNPLGGQKHVLHPSLALKVVPGTHLGGSTQSKLQIALFFKPFGGQIQVLHPFIGLKC